MLYICKYMAYQYLVRVYPVHGDLGFLRALCIALTRSNHRAISVAQW